MGDRTTVTLTVLACQEKEVLALLRYEPQETTPSTTGRHTYLTFYEINYGELDNLDGLLEAGVPFTSRWEAGGDYGAGEKSCRFTPEGEAILKEIYDSGVNPELHTLMTVIDNPVALRQAVLNHAEEVSVLPWDNQEEYGKLYRARQLIAPKEA